MHVHLEYRLQAIPLRPTRPSFNLPAPCRQRLPNGQRPAIISQLEQQASGKATEHQHRCVLKRFENQLAAMAWPMPRRFYYHVTPTDNFGSIRETGLKPRAGERWDAFTEEVLTWTPRIFLATGRMAAYDVANDFLWDGKAGEYLIIFLIERSGVPGKIFPDLHYYTLPSDSALRRRRRRLGSVCTGMPIPASALVGYITVRQRFFDTAEFGRWIGNPPKRRRRLKSVATD